MHKEAMSTTWATEAAEAIMKDWDIWNMTEYNVWGERYRRELIKEAVSIILSHCPKEE